MENIPKNCIPFNVEGLANGLEVVYRSGEPAIVLTTTRPCNTTYNFCIISMTSDGETLTHRIDGGNWRHGESDFDLFFKREIVEGWVNMYHPRNPNYDAYPIGCYPTKEIALEHIKTDKKYLCTVPVEFPKCLAE